MLPLARPALIGRPIFNAIGCGTSTPLALVLLASDEIRTSRRHRHLDDVGGHYQSDYGALFAGLVIVMVPVLAV